MNTKLNTLLLITSLLLFSCSKKEDESVLSNKVEVPPLSAFPLQVSQNVAFNYQSFMGSVDADEKCRAIAIDSEDNIYCAGEVSTDFGEEYGGGDSDAYIMKVNSAGIIQWVTQLGAEKVTDGVINSSDSIDKCFSLVVDSQDNVYCGGSTFSDLKVPLSGAAEDAFIMKLNSSGEVQWVTQLSDDLTEINDSSAQEKCYSLAVDSNDNVICAGQTQGDFVEANSGWGDIFVAKLNNAGTLIWVKHIGETTKVSASLDTTEDENCLSVAVDANDNIYCGGYAWGSLADTNPDPSMTSDMIVFKMNSSGTIQWFDQQGNSSSFDTSFSEECRSLALDSNANVYCAGETSSSMIETNLDVENSSDIFVVKYNSAGVVQWGSQLGEASAQSLDIGVEVNPNNLDNVRSILLDGSGNVYVGGATFSSLGDSATDGSRDIFIAKFNPSGVIQGVFQLGTASEEASSLVEDVSQDDDCYSLAMDSEGNIFCGGFTTGGLFDAKAESGYGDTDIIILKLDSEGNISQ